MAYKIQHLGLGGILDQAIAITKNHFTLLFTIMLLVLIPFELINEYIYLSAELTITPDASDLEMLDETGASLVEPDLPAWYDAWMTLYLLSYGFVVFPLTNAAVIHAVAKLYLGQPVTAFEAMKFGLRRFLPLIGATILFSMAVMGGMILFIIPGIIFAILLSSLASFASWRFNLLGALILSHQVIRLPRRSLILFHVHRWDSSGSTVDLRRPDLTRPRRGRCQACPLGIELPAQSLQERFRRRVRV